MSEEKRRESAGRVASAIALPEWSLRRKLALALTIPMLLAATFGAAPSAIKPPAKPSNDPVPAGRRPYTPDRGIER